jgi:hypothetical protein
MNEHMSCLCDIHGMHIYDAMDSPRSGSCMGPWECRAAVCGQRGEELEMEALWGRQQGMGSRNEVRTC